MPKSYAQIRVRYFVRYFFLGQPGRSTLFNLKVKTSIAILEYFLDKLDTVPTLFLHFEMIPDRFPKELREYVTRFPKGQIQFEIGIQTFNSDVATRIQRKQNYQALKSILFVH